MTMLLRAWCADYVRKYLQTQNPVEKLADEIRAGIATRGCFILDGTEMADVWDRREIPDDQKRHALDQFAATHRFSLYLTPHVKVAVFTKAE